MFDFDCRIVLKLYIKRDKNRWTKKVFYRPTIVELLVAVVLYNTNYRNYERIGIC